MTTGKQQANQYTKTNFFNFYHNLTGDVVNPNTQKIGHNIGWYEQLKYHA
jgi:hypothetical protein